MTYAQDNRIEKRFKKLKKQNRSALVSFIMAHDPDRETSFNILKKLPDAGVDFIELGMAFTDPMADGPVIQLAADRALKSGVDLDKTLEMVEEFRGLDTETPIILMGYYNPIYVYGIESFLDKAKKCGVDGLIIVDLPPEEDKELCEPSLLKNIDFIRLITPTSDDKRLDIILNNSRGFLYYVSVVGVTGTKSAKEADIGQALMRIRQKTSLPIAVGFGIKTAGDVKKMAKHADAVVVGSAIVSRIENGVSINKDTNDIVDDVIEFVKTLSRPLNE